MECYFMQHWSNGHSLPDIIFGVPTAMKYTPLKCFCYVAAFPGMSIREVLNSFEFHF